ncbi:TDP-N-acetylfucosamine:lipid II N-acetylfucosaminyltransferase [compost metagenome]
MKILHIGPDSQFIQFISKTFELAAPGCSDYAVTSKKPLNYEIPNGQVKAIGSSLASLFRIALLSRKYDAIVAHSLTNQAVFAFLVAPRKTLKVWSGWGFDYYTNNVFTLLGDESKKLYKELEEGCKKEEPILKAALKKIFSKLKSLSIGKIDYFSAPIPNDFFILKENYPQFCGEYIQLNYGSAEETFNLGGCFVTGKNILLGNSASITNNHIEAFEKIKKIAIKEQKVIVPLSYGDKKYRDAVIAKGKDCLGGLFCPLTDFVPLREYSKIVNSCNLIVMAHKRQQALGNICTAMYSGARVILDEENPAYQFFIERGAIVNSLNDISNSSILTPLSESEISQNRKVIQTFWGAEKVKNNTKKLIDKIQTKQQSRANK